MSRPDYGEQVELQPGDVSVFWACGVTAIEAILSSSEDYDFLKPYLFLNHHICFIVIEVF